MALGVKPVVGEIKVGDSAELYASLRIDDQPVSPDQVAQANFIIQKPDGTITTDIGLVQDDGQGFYRWTDTSLAGPYLVQAQFELVSGEVRSVMSNFAVVDPFADAPIPTEVEMITDAVWLRLEDCFDTIEGGPWLKEKSLYNFDENKIAVFIPEALLDINVQMPPSSFGLDFFTTPTHIPGDNPNQPLLTKGVLCLTIRHLMRSYTEQPTVMGAQVVWHDRTRYQQMWKAIYDVEYADYIAAVRLWKRTTLNLGRSALSTFSKAGRLYPYASQRTRGAYRGYY